MTDRYQQRRLLRGLWLATAVVLVLLLLAGSASHPSVSQLWFILVPVFLFAIVAIQERCFVDETDAVANDPSPVASLFERPPPPLI